MAAPGICGVAWADAWTGAPAGAGAIGGGFFSTVPVVPSGLSAGVRLPPALTANSGADLCAPAIASASASYNLPAGLLSAIAKVESGRQDPQSGLLTAWPWTIDANGAGYMYSTEPAATAAAAGFQASGITSLDIGCLQVNLVQHPQAFQNLAEAFDPASNANYAASFLASLEQKFGNWPQAVAAYHSQTPALGGPYADKVYAEWQGTSAPVALASAGGVAHDPLPGPALQPALPQTAFEMSSLIAPMRTLQRGNNAPTGRSLASYRAAPVAIAGNIAPMDMPPRPNPAMAMPGG